MSEFKYINVEKQKFSDDPMAFDFQGDLQLELVHQLKRIGDELAKRNNSGDI